jgi:hypothetical protein
MIAPAAQMMLLYRPKFKFLRFQMTVNTQTNGSGPTFKAKPLPGLDIAALHAQRKAARSPQLLSRHSDVNYELRFPLKVAPKVLRHRALGRLSPLSDLVAESNHRHHRNQCD